MRHLNSMCCEREQSISRKESALAFSVHFSANTPHNPGLERQLSSSTVCSWEAGVFISTGKSSCCSWGLFLTFAKALSGGGKTLMEGSNNVLNGKYWCSGWYTDKLKKSNYIFAVLGKWNQELNPLRETIPWNVCMQAVCFLISSVLIIMKADYIAGCKAYTDTKLQTYTKFSIFHPYIRSLSQNPCAKRLLSGKLSD